MLQDPEDTDINVIVKLGKRGAQDVLVVNHYVGVIKTAQGTHIEILPKISKVYDQEASRKLLVRMLIDLRYSRFKEGTQADLAKHSMPIFETLIKVFLDHVSDIVRKGIARTYVSEQDNLVYLRGKLQLNQHLVKNVVDRSRFYCEYDVYEQDRPLNRLIKHALEIVRSITKDPKNRQRVREFLYWFGSVRPSKDITRDFQSIRYDRLAQHYQPAMPICELILKKFNPLTQTGKNRVISVLFSMHDVFEDYVTQKLHTQFSDWRVNSQVRREHLVHDHQGKRYYQLKPDLEFVPTTREGSDRIIGDIKWKLINSGSSYDYNIKQNDLYQIFSYLKKYLRHQSHKKAVLIYPLTDSFRTPLKEFWFDENKHEVLYVLPFDLSEEKEELVVSDNLFVATSST